MTSFTTHQSLNSPFGLVRQYMCHITAKMKGHHQQVHVEHEIADDVLFTLLYYKMNFLMS